MKKIIILAVALLAVAGSAVAQKAAKQIVTTVFITDLDCENCAKKVYDNFYGKGANNTPLSKQNTFTYGASLGGAFVKNKLFYFVNAENSTNLSPSAYHIGDPNCKVAEKDAITIAEHYKSLTGYDGGGYGSRNIERRSTSILARVDWHISDKHNLAVRYNYLDAGKDEYVNSAATLLLSPAISPPIIVAPLLLVPGIKDNNWNPPTANACL